MVSLAEMEQRFVLLISVTCLLESGAADYRLPYHMKFSQHFKVSRKKVSQKFAAPKISNILKLNNVQLQLL